MDPCFFDIRISTVITNITARFPSQEVYTLGHPDTLETKNDLDVLSKEQGDYTQAEPLLIQAVEDRRLKLADTHPHTIESWRALIGLYEAWNKPEKAEELRAKLPQIKAVDE
jgi:hypothetical protein